MVQQLIAQHFKVVSQFWKPTGEAYIGLGRMYCEHADFRKMYDRYHPDLAEFLATAMKFYAETQLHSFPY